MTKDRIMTLARDGGFVVGRNTEERTYRLVNELVMDGKLKISSKFKEGDGCRVVPCV